MLPAPMGKLARDGGPVGGASGLSEDFLGPDEGLMHETALAWTILDPA